MLESAGLLYAGSAHHFERIGDRQLRRLPKIIPPMSTTPVISKGRLRQKCFFDTWVREICVDPVSKIISPVLAVISRIRCPLQSGCSETFSKPLALKSNLLGSALLYSKQYESSVSSHSVLDGRLKRIPRPWVRIRSWAPSWNQIATEPDKSKCHETESLFQYCSTLLPRHDSAV